MGRVALSKGLHTFNMHRILLELMKEGGTQVDESVMYTFVFDDKGCCFKFFGTICVPNTAIPMENKEGRRATTAFITIEELSFYLRQRSFKH